MKYKKLSFVIPAYNEEKTIEQIIEKIIDLKILQEKEVVIVNDFSADKTSQILKKYSKKKNFIIINNEKNLGKSQSVKKGLIKTSGDLIVIQDADLEYEPENLIDFVELFEEKDLDLVYGNRFNGKNKVMYWKNWFGNKSLSFLSSLFTYPRSGIWTNDMEVCYKMSKGEIFRDIANSLVSKTHFGLEPELTARFSKYRSENKKLKFAELKIDYNPRSFEEGKKINALKDGIKAILEILRFNIISR